MEADYSTIMSECISRSVFSCDEKVLKDQVQKISDEVIKILNDLAEKNGYPTRINQEDVNKSFEDALKKASSLKYEFESIDKNRGRYYRLYSLAGKFKDIHVKSSQGNMLIF